SPNRKGISGVFQLRRLEPFFLLFRDFPVSAEVCDCILYQMARRPTLRLFVSLIECHNVIHVVIVDNSLRFVKDFSRFVLKWLATHVYNSPPLPIPVPESDRLVRNCRRTPQSSLRLRQPA